VSLTKWLTRLIQRLVSSSAARRTASHVAAASLTTAVVASAGEAQAPPKPDRPAGASARDTVHRYGEKFILSPTDSVVIRADTVWFPRAGTTAGKATPPVTAPRPATDTARPPTSGARGHGSHASHSSHRSAMGNRRGF
jgi:hypothetical protein